ncbi:MAG: hypothetical protein H7177_05155 [Rhizobacter sp.]|nr:hypothetical protein [Bacteriovorax sp.]
MKFRIFIIFFAVFFITNAKAMDFDTFSKIDEAKNTFATKYSGLSTEKLTELTTFIEKATAKSVEKPKLIGQESTSDSDCSHCPKHVQLAGDINKILDQMKKDPKVGQEEEVPVNINRLKFLYYSVKTRQDDGAVTCNRYKDITPDLKPTKFDGAAELMAENVFKFSGTTAVQILDPKTEEIIYYYRGEGDQRNIIVQAILNKDGGKFRYYYYRPTEEEKNPYGIPSMGSAAIPDVTLKKAELNLPKIIQTSEDKIDSKNKFKLSVDPTLETKMVVIPKNIHVAEAEVSQNIGGADGVRVNAKSHLSLRGNEANMNLQNEKGTSYIQVDVLTNLKGETTRTVTVPYEVKLGAADDKDAVKVTGKMLDSSTQQLVTFALTDSSTSYMRTEFKKDKLTNANSYVVAKDFSIDKDQMATVAVGRNEMQNKYVSLQHRLAVKDNLTMVLDVRVDENKRTSFMYQLKAKF